MKIEFYIGNLLLFLIYSILINKLKYDRKKSGFVLFLISAIHILFIQSFLDNDKLLDSISYIYVFDNARYASVSEIITEAMTNEWGIGFMLYTKLISNFTNDIHFYYMITYAIIDIPLLWYFYKVSHNYTLTILLYLCHPMLFWDSNYILRQHMVISLSALVIYYSNKNIIAIPMTIVAVSMHLSGLILIPFLLWKNLDLSRASLSKIFFVVILSLVVMGAVFYRMIAQSDRYSGYLSADKSSNIVPFLLIGPLVVFLFYKRKHLYKDLQESSLFEFLLYGLVIALFTVNSSFGRITTYFVAFVPAAASLLYKYPFKDRLLLNCYVLFAFAIEGVMLYLNCTNLFVGNLIQNR